MNFDLATDSSQLFKEECSFQQNRKLIMGGIMGLQGGLTWGGEHTIQYPHDVLQNCPPESYITL